MWDCQPGNLTAGKGSGGGGKGKQLANVSVPLDHFPVNTLTSKVFSFMVKKGKHFSGKVTPLFATMLVQPTRMRCFSKDHLRHFTTRLLLPLVKYLMSHRLTHLLLHSKVLMCELRLIISSSSREELGVIPSVINSHSGNEVIWSAPSVYDLCLSLCAQVSDQAKEIQHLKAQITKLKKKAKPGAQRVDPNKGGSLLELGRTKNMVDEEPGDCDENTLVMKIYFVSDKEGVSTDMEKVSTEEKNEGTKEHIEGTEEQVEISDGHKKGTEEEIDTQSTQTSTQTPTSTIFGDDETIAKVLLNMSQAKAVSREKEKGPLLKIDPKDKGKKKIEKGDESESESDGIPEAEKKFKQLETDEEMARKMQEEWEDERADQKMNEKGIDSSNNDERVWQESYEEECAVLRVTVGMVLLILWGDLKIMMESSTKGNEQSDFWSGQQDWKIVTWRLYESCGVCILEFEDGIVIHMLVERRYPLSKDLLQRMLDLGLEVERESSVALDLIRFIKQQIDEE
ncbi:hypothetical protein Tco_1037344 [Tanacetum coccineum]